MKKRILFLCTGNSCRSQMAEGIANKIFDQVDIKSAGTEAHGINPIAIKVMNQISISMEQHSSDIVNFNKINEFDIVITLCGDAKDKCPIFNKNTTHIHWPIEDPANFKGTDEDVIIKYAEVRDIIYKKINELKIKLRKK